jgi:hypothetical protein
MSYRDGARCAERASLLRPGIDTLVGRARVPRVDGIQVSTDVIRPDTLHPYEDPRKLALVPDGDPPERSAVTDDVIDGIVAARVVRVPAGESVEGGAVVIECDHVVGLHHQRLVLVVEAFCLVELRRNVASGIESAGPVARSGGGGDREEDCRGSGKGSEKKHPAGETSDPTVGEGHWSSFGR